MVRTTRSVARELTETIVRQRRIDDSRKRRNPKLEVRHRIMPQEAPDEDRFYVIEKLVDKRINSLGAEEYLVKWQNYPAEWNSWEPRSEIERNAADMVKGFEGKLDQSLQLHCFCRQTYKFNQGGMIQCFHCMTWYHFTCLGMNMEEANSYAKFYCDQCKKTNPSFRSAVKEEKFATFYGRSLAETL